MVESASVPGPGRGPAKREKSWYSFGAIGAARSMAVQEIVRGARVRVVPSMVTGLGSGASTTLTRQPARGLALTEANG